MKKSGEVISSARCSYRKRLSLVIDNYQVNSKRDVYLVDTPEFKKEGKGRRGKVGIGEESVKSPFQIQQSMREGWGVREVTRQEVVSPRKTQEMMPASKPKAMITVDELLQTKTLAIKLMTSPTNKISPTLPTNPTQHYIPKRLAMTERSSKPSWQNIPSSTPNHPLPSKQKRNINHQISQISTALTKCKQSLQNILKPIPTINNALTERTKNLIQKEDFTHTRPLYSARKYPYSARK